MIYLYSTNTSISSPVSYNGLSITVFHTVDPGSIPGAGKFFLLLDWVVDEG